MVCKIKKPIIEGRNNKIKKKNYYPKSNDDEGGKVKEKNHPNLIFGNCLVE